MLRMGMMRSSAVRSDTRSYFSLAVHAADPHVFVAMLMRCVAMKRVVRVVMMLMVMVVTLTLTVTLIITPVPGPVVDVDTLPPNM